MGISKQKSCRGHVRFYCLLCLLMGLIITKYSLQIDIPRLLFLGIILLIVIIGDRDEVVAMCICCISLHESVDFFYATAFCVIGYVVKYPESIRFHLPVIPVLLIIAWELLHCFGQPLDAVKLITEMIPFLVLLIFMGAELSDIDYSFVIRAFSVSTALVGLSMLLRVVYLADFNLAIAFASLQRLGVGAEGTKISSGAIHPNSLGIICILAATGLMQLRTTGRGKKTDLVLTILLLVLGALTASRTFLACLALMGLLLWFSQKGSIKQKIRFLGSLLLILLLSLIVLGFVFPDLLEYFYRRFLEKDLTTGRVDLMSKYHAFIVSDPSVLFFGIGLHDLSEKVTVVYRIAQNVPHNGVQEIVVAWGLVGIVLFGSLLFVMIWRSRQICKQQQLLNFIPLLILIFKVQAGQIITSGYTMMALLYVYLSLIQCFRKQELSERTTLLKSFQNT